MEEILCDKIALHQMNIEEIKQIKTHVDAHIDDDVKFIIKTKQFFLPVGNATKYKDILDISTSTMSAILENTIKNERQEIDKLIDALIELKIKNNEERG